MAFHWYDTLQNFVSGMMSLGDKRQHDKFYFLPLSKEQIDAAYRTDWITRKAVDIPAYDSTRAWRDWQAEDDQIEALENEEKRLCLRQRVMRAMTLARLYGGAGIYLGTDQGSPSEELRPDRIRSDSLKFLHVFSKHELMAGEIDTNLESPNYGTPLQYTVNTNKGQVEIHPSRIVRFIGNEIPDTAQVADGWGDSVVQVLDDAIKATGLTAQSIAGLVHEAKVDVIHIPNLADHLATAAAQGKLLSRFGLANAMKSNSATLLLDEAETWERKEMNFGGLSDVLRLYLQIASGAADIPVTRMLGQAPAGLNATGDSDTRNYYDMVSSRQEVDLRPLMERIDAVLLPSTFGSPQKDIWFEFAPLWQMTEAEKATIAKSKADTSAVYVNSGLVPSSALATGVQNMLIEDGTFPGLEAALEEAEAALDVPPLLEEPEDDPEDDPSVKPEEDKKIAEDAAALLPAKPLFRIVIDTRAHIESYAIINDRRRTIERHATFPEAESALARLLKN